MLGQLLSGSSSSTKQNRPKEAEVTAAFRCSNHIHSSSCSEWSEVKEAAWGIAAEVAHAAAVTAARLEIENAEVEQRQLATHTHQLKETNDTKHLRRKDETIFLKQRLTD